MGRCMRCQRLAVLRFMAKQLQHHAVSFNAGVVRGLQPGTRVLRLSSSSLNELLERDLQREANH